MMAPSTLFFFGGMGRVVTNSMNKGKTMTEPTVASALRLCSRYVRIRPGLTCNAASGL